MAMRISKAKMINVICGACGSPITDPRFSTMTELAGITMLAAQCPKCGTIHQLDLTERMEKLGKQRK